MTIGVFPIVEGHGEVAAVPALVRRFAEEVHRRFDYRVLEPYRLARTKFAQDAEIVRALRFAAIKLQPFTLRHVLVLMDADDDCPAEQHERIQRIVTESALPLNVGFVMPTREYEAWFIGCLDRSKPHADIRDEIPALADPSTIRDAKGWFRSRVLAPGRPYSPSVDQAKFTYLIDLAAPNDRALLKLRKEMAAIFTG